MLVIIIIIFMQEVTSMANLKYSRQREAIKDYLSSVTTHPTADTVYMHIKEEFPNISLGTVYRQFKSACRHRRGD